MDPNSNPTNPTDPSAFPPTRPSVVQGPEYKVDSHNEIEATKKVSRKFIFIISFILALLIPLSIFGYTQIKKNSYKSITVGPTPATVVKPTTTPNPTANWQTYESTGFTNNFSVKYPSSFVVSSTSESVVLESSDQATDSATLSGKDLQISFSEKASSQDLSKDPQSLANALADSQTNVTFTTTQVDGQSGVSLSNSTFYTVGIYRNGEIFEISGKSGPDGVDSLTQLFPTVLSTFKFSTQAEVSPSPTASVSAQ